jgi:hypothetical protein
MCRGIRGRRPLVRLRTTAPCDHAKSWIAIPKWKRRAVESVLELLARVLRGGCGGTAPWAVPCRGAFGSHVAVAVALLRVAFVAFVASWQGRVASGCAGELGGESRGWGRLR